MSTSSARDSILKTPAQMGWLIAGQASAAVLYFGFTSFLIRTSGPELFGKLNLCFVVTNLLFAFSGLWLETAAIKFSKEAVLQAGSQRTVFWTRAWLSFGLMAIYMVPLFILRDLFYRYLAERDLWTLVFTAAYAFLTLAQAMISAALVVRGRMDRMAGMTMADRATGLIGLLALHFIFRTEATVHILLALLCVSRVISIFIQISLRRTSDLYQVFRPRPAELRPILAFSWPFLVTTPFQFGNRWMDIVLLRFFVELTQLGIYSAVYQFYLVGCIVTAAMSNVFYPLIVELLTLKREDLLRKLMRIGLFHLMYFWTAALCLMILMSPVLLALMDATLKPYAPMLSLFFFSLSMYGIASPYGVIPSSLGHTRSFMASNIILMVIQILLNVVLIPKFGILGAAFASVVTSLVTMIFYMILSHRPLAYLAVPWDALALIGFPAALAAIQFVRPSLIVPAEIAALIGYVWIFRTHDLFHAEVIRLYDDVHAPEFVRKALTTVFGVIRGK